MNNKILYAISLLLVFTLAACGKKEAPPAAPAVSVPVMAPAAGVTVSQIMLGNAIGVDKRVTTASDIFGKNDTIYATIETQGSGNATLKAVWTFKMADKSVPVTESSQTISAQGQAVNEFHVSKADGWPVGNYQVEVYVNNTSAGNKSFSVK